ncbi:MAG: DUF4105 domain-containing protein [Muribaculum sp.]|nr:DUF4105 domain-containing protein [Muribaculum sp.]
MIRLKLILISLIAPILALAQPTETKVVQSDSTKSDIYKVSLLTCRAGADIYELEGHAALRIINEATGSDMVVNWGLFDFAAPNFVYRFVKGETDYSVGVAPTNYFVNSYAWEKRKVIEQQLDLTQEQTVRLMELIENNLRTENRVYRYNYVLDNCATRPLDMIEKALGDSLHFSGADLSPEVTTTFRNAMRQYHKNYPWYQFGIDLALGNGIDRPISLREASFAPESLEIMMANAKKKDGSPIVTNTICLTSPSSSTAISDPTPWWQTPMTIALLVLAISLILTIRQVKTHHFNPSTATRIFDTLLFSINGVLGLVLTFLIFISVHEATSPNWLYLWLNPLCLIGALAIWVKCAKLLLFYYQIVNFALLIILVAILLCGLQSPNPAFYPLIAADALRALGYLLTYKHHNNNKIYA